MLPQYRCIYGGKGGGIAARDRRVGGRHRASVVVRGQLSVGGVIQILEKSVTRDLVINVT